MKNFLLGLLALLMTLARIALMVIAYCVVCPTEWLMTAQEHVDRARGVPIPGEDK